MADHCCGPVAAGIGVPHAEQPRGATGVDIRVAAHGCVVVCVGWLPVIVVAPAFGMPMAPSARRHRHPLDTVSWRRAHSRVGRHTMLWCQLQGAPLTPSARRWTMLVCQGMVALLSPLPIVSAFLTVLGVCANGSASPGLQLLRCPLWSRSRQRPLARWTLLAPPGVSWCLLVCHGVSGLLLASPGVSWFLLLLMVSYG